MMKQSLPKILAGSLSLLAVSAIADGPFYGDPPNATHPWAVHDMNRPQPVQVTPGSFSSDERPGTPPSDAVILFSGRPEDIQKWQSDKPGGEPTKWVVENGLLQCVPGSGYIRTREEFSDCQLHIEWSEPENIEGSSQGRGNSGVFLMGQVEVQVLDSHKNPTYADGSASSVYGINPPMVNVIRPPGKWQTYDIVFRRPLFKDGKEIDPGYITVFVNGVLTQDHTALEGKGGHRGRSVSQPFPEAGPLKLQDHGNPVRFRNIWLRPLPKRAVEGGDASRMSEEATSAKRAETAKGIREDAAKLEGTAKMLRLFESLVYEDNAEARKEATAALDAFAKGVKDLDANKLNLQKGDILKVASALQYLAKFKFIDQDTPAKAALEQLVNANGWQKKK
jgi:hypothetical protein